MKSGATHDKFGVLYTVWLPIEFHGFTSRINSKGYHSLVPGLISIFFRGGMGPFNTLVCVKANTCIYMYTYMYIAHAQEYALFFH